MLVHDVGHLLRINLLRVSARILEQALPSQQTTDGLNANSPLSRLRASQSMPFPTNFSIPSTSSSLTLIVPSPPVSYLKKRLVRNCASFSLLQSNPKHRHEPRPNHSATPPTQPRHSNQPSLSNRAYRCNDFEFGADEQVTSLLFLRDLCWLGWWCRRLPTAPSTRQSRSSSTKDCRDIRQQPFAFAKICSSTCLRYNLFFDLPSLKPVLRLGGAAHSQPQHPRPRPKYASHQTKKKSRGVPCRHNSSVLVDGLAGCCKLLKRPVCLAPRRRFFLYEILVPILRPKDLFDAMGCMPRTRP